VTPDDGPLLERFRRALSERRLGMRYQPKVRLCDGRVTSVEALMRWTDPDFGRMGPQQFVALAERNGLIGELTEFGLGTTLKQWLAWRDQGLDIRVAFNISAMSLGHLDFPDLVEAMCVEAGVPTHQVVIELTEGATQPLVNLMDTLTRFRIKGFRLAIDDFGTGYSSMMQLHQLPFTEVKIDRSFVADAARAADSRLIVKTIIDLAHGLDMVVTAEGIEEPEQIDLLRELGCDLAQGFLISQPMDAAEVVPWTRKFEGGWKEALRSGDLELWGNVETDSPG
jgi:EAL domain-containing protein (putative c-di-GMP-specific phosphodiesterase class I)